MFRSHYGLATAIDHTIVYGEARNGIVSANQGAITAATLVTTVIR